jgi:hypothetical protein
MGIGLLLVVTYVVEPLRLLWLWFQHMALPLQIGLGVAGIGLAILMTSLVFERATSRSYDDKLKKL